MNSVGIVIIGRNEGQRLRRCLESTLSRGMTAVYVDSGSTDGSVEMARMLGACVVELDCSRPFSAARARNVGLEHLLKVNPGIEFVQFIDGDCQVVESWLQRALGQMLARPDLAVVCGRRRELFPEASLYNRLCDLEWNGPPGETDACGGDALMRVRPFLQVGGFDPSVPAGEEPELCRRLREKEWTILRLDADMTWHDAAILRFSQWWRRQVRTGYGSLDMAVRFNMSRFARQVRSAEVWTLGFALVLLAVTVSTALLAQPRFAALAAAAILLLPPLQAFRIAFASRRRGLPFALALACGALTMISKWGQVLGHARYVSDRLTGRNARLIEYKGIAHLRGQSAEN